jgi:hypothetical protein
MSKMWMWCAGSVDRIAASAPSCLVVSGVAVASVSQTDSRMRKRAKLKASVSGVCVSE